ncbi:MAG: hypothetical protein AB7S39_19025 [Gemmatimonadales bacterium]
MKGILAGLALLAMAGCNGATNPIEKLPIYPGWFLSTIDGAYPPIPDWNGGTLVAAGLYFRDFTADGNGGSGVVTFTTNVLRGSVPEPTSADLNFTISGGQLRINLCPPGGACFAVTDELHGPIGERTDPLVLTRYVGGQAGAVFRFGPALPD